MHERMCVACRKMRDKTELFRVTKAMSGKILLDTTYKADGRGAYICRNKDCVELCIKKKGLNRAFKGDVGTEIYDELRKHI